MRFRRQNARWFETYVPRAESVHAMEALAETGRVELESDSRLSHPLELRGVRRAVAEFRELAGLYGDLLPECAPGPPALMASPEQMAREAMHRLRPWRDSVAWLLKRRRALERERESLALLCELLAALDGASIDLSGLSRPSRFLYKRVFACSHGHRLDADVCAAVGELFSGAEHDFFIVAVLAENSALIERAYRSEACVDVDLPEWLSADPAERHSQVEGRRQAVESRIGILARELEAQKHEPGIADAVTTMTLLSWFVERAGDLSADERMCHITGWTTADGPDELQRALAQVHVHGVIRFAPAPVFSRAPVGMVLPPWARPFQLFIEMVGTPGNREIDPSGLLPVIVPLLFGYMFPDVGHGLLLALLSALLYRRWPQGRFLVPCGISAALFGVVFGEVFGLEDVLNPLWLHPLDHPFEVLGAPLVLGVLLMLTGVAFGGVEAYWRGEVRRWLLGEAVLLLLYGAALAGLFCTGCLWVAAPLLVWFILGQLRSAEKHRLAHLAAALGRLLQSAFELLLNTLSFLRVGAFALAHAALSGAVLQLADGLASPVLHWLFLILGHALIIAVEGLVVFVQTTRLVLFEFFVRFLKAEGRIFRPLSRRPEDSGRERP
ncbi:MAG: V-type ATPase 116kDa subunit family protein [Chromatiales bacterium]|jgi:V/A-type H+-transporting ATPase subunit I